MFSACERLGRRRRLPGESDYAVMGSEERGLDLSVYESAKRPM